MPFSKTMLRQYLPLLLVLLLAGLTAGASPSSAAEAVARTAVSVEGSPSIGPAEAPVTIVEFIDYQ